MCMKYVNATVECYAGMTRGEGTPVSYNHLFNGLYASLRQNGTLEIGGFIVVTRINLIGTASEKNKGDNILERRGILDVKVILTKCDSDEKKQLSIDLDAYSLDFSRMDAGIEHACYDFYTHTRVSEVKDFDLEAGTGKYVIKVLVKTHEETDDDYTIQAMSGLYIAAPET